MSDHIEMIDFLGFSKDALDGFCRKWKIQKLELFGSVLTDEFAERSDIDFLISFADGVGPDLYDFVELKDELQRLVNRSVDVVDREVVEKSDNRFRREAILSMTKVLYEQAA